MWFSYPTEDICIIYENVYFSFQKSKGQRVHSKPGGTALLELGYCLAAQGPSPPSYLRPKSKFKASPLHTALHCHDLTDILLEVISSCKSFIHHKNYLIELEKKNIAGK